MESKIALSSGIQWVRLKKVQRSALGIHSQVALFGFSRAVFQFDVANLNLRYKHADQSHNSKSANIAPCLPLTVLYGQGLVPPL